MGKSRHSRFYNKSEWSVSDCDCRWCGWFRGKNRGCILEECACAEERAEAYRREREAKKASRARRKQREEMDYDAQSDE